MSTGRVLDTSAAGQPLQEAIRFSGRAEGEAPLLSVIVPVFNEGSTIDQLLERVVKARYEPQVIVVDDGSSDETPAQLAKWADHPQVTVLRHAQNRGKGAAIRTGLAAARGRYCLVQDADLEYDPSEYPTVIEPLRNGAGLVVYGSRYLRSHVRGGWFFRQGVRVLNLAVRWLYGQRLTDEATCYKALPTALLRHLQLECERFEFCPEVTAKVCRLGVSILEVPVSYHPRTSAAGKKIRLSDGWQALTELWRWRRWQPTADARLWVHAEQSTLVR
jgi:dolichol-phosphate mannosyltransferase